MNIFDRLLKWIETDVVEPVEHAAEEVIHFVEKETHMLTQDFTDLFSQAKAGLARLSQGRSADAATIASLRQQNQDLQTKLDAANSALTDANSSATTQVQTLQGQLADTQSELDDAKTQLTDLLSQIVALSPPPAA